MFQFRRESIEHYRYLWDGTKPEWVLVHLNCQAVSLGLVFGSSGPSLDEVTRVRRAVPAFTQLTTSELLAKFRGQSFVDLGEFESSDAHRIAKFCRTSGLQVREQVQDRSRYVPLNEKTNACLIIEDDGLSKEVCKEALKQGIRVKHVEA